MHTISLENEQSTDTLNPNGRACSPKIRQSQTVTDEFCGLERTAKPYELLLLVKRVGKAGGFTTRMIHLLEYYLAFTREIDWQEGQYPIVYQTQTKTAMDLGISERQVQRLEKALAEVGALAWQDSGNYRRYGQRCPETGEILYACGVNLAPLAGIEANLRRQLAEKQAVNGAWHKTKCRISQARRKIKAAVEQLSARADVDQLKIESILGDTRELSTQIRTHMSLDALLDLLHAHEKVLNSLLAALKSVLLKRVKNIKMSFRSAIDVVYFKYTNTSKFLKRNTNKAPLVRFQGAQSGLATKQARTSARMDRANEPERLKSRSAGIRGVDTGTPQMTIQQAVGAASERFLGCMPVSAKPADWAQLVEAAYRLGSELGISQRHWGEACAVMGRTGAALCVLVTDRAAQRDCGRVTKPAGYFYAMVKRARTGELRLHKSFSGSLN